MRISLSWLKDYIDIKEKLAQVQDILTMIGLEVTSVHDIEGDNVMDIEVTPNRPDCLSILGIAREYAAATNRHIKIPASIGKNYGRKGAGRGSAKIEIQDKKSCPRYVGCIIKNVKVGPSPKWLVARLNAMGVRSVNNIVDATNYVLFETGQPLHAFDLDKLEGKEIIVRKAKKDETIVTIDAVRRGLEAGMLVIADAEKPVAIAGIMGGKDTEISDSTKHILLESAYFDPISIRKSQRKLGISSESSYRFERNVDYAMVLSASMRAQEMIKKIAGGKEQGTVDVGGKQVREKEIEFSLNEIKRVLGIEMDSKKVVGFLKRLELKVIKKRKNEILVKIPPYRQDIETQIDLIEEVARFYGYDNCPVKLPLFTIQKTYEAEKKEHSIIEKEAKKILYALGLNEIITYTLTSRYAIESLGVGFDNLVRLNNPLSANQEFMRPNLLSEMLEVMSWNLNRKNSILQLFELSKVYSIDKKKDEIEEKPSLAIGMCGTTIGNWKEKPRDIDFFDLKGIVELFLNFMGVKDYVIEDGKSFIFREGMSTHIKIEGNTCGMLGEVKPDVARKFDIKDKVYLTEISFEELLKYADLKKRFETLPRYPSIKRDISMIVNGDITASKINAVIEKESKGIVRGVDVFDLYKGQQIEQGKKSLAYTLEYRSDEKTLKDEDIKEIHSAIQDALVKKLGAQIR